MADSFFTASNYVDQQLDAQKPTAFHCECLLEASVRQLIKRSSSRTAAEKLYWLADICAGADVMPLETQRAPAPADPVVQKRHWLIRFSRTISWSYWTGLAVGFWLGSTWR